MARNLTKFKVYRNTPFINFYTTLHFDSNAERDSYFNGWADVVTFDNHNFNMKRSRLIVDMPINLDDTSGLNYCSFDDGGIKYYCYITNFEYFNDEVSKATLVVDTLMTFTQGEFTNNIGYVMIDRQHLPASEYNKNLYYLRSNPDLFHFDKRYRYQAKIAFDDLSVVFASSADLEGDFGDVDSPKLPMAKGVYYDRIPSPQALYTCSQDEFNKLNSFLSDYAWIAQNITKIAQVPSVMIDSGDITEIKIAGFDATIYRFYNNHVSKDIMNGRTDLNLTFAELYSKAYHGTYTIPPHLFTSPNVTLEAFDFSGQKIEINPKELPDYGLEWEIRNITGHANVIALYPKTYQSDGENTDNEMNKGTFLNNAIILSTFDEVPILVNNFNLNMAKSSFSRNLAKARTLSGRVSSIEKGNLQDKLFNAISLTSSISTGSISGVASNISNMAISEYELSRDQHVQEKEYSIESPSLSNQTTNNSFQVKEKIFGVAMKLSAPDDTTMEYLARYSGKFGYQWNRFDKPQSITSMTLQNFLKFTGVWNLPNVPVEHMTTLSALFEAGVHFYHKPNFFKLDLINNTNK